MGVGAARRDANQSAPTTSIVQRTCSSLRRNNDLTNGDMSLMLFKWTTELAFLRAKFLAKCILERAAFSAEKQHNRGALLGLCSSICARSSRGAVAPQAWCLAQRAPPARAAALQESRGRICTLSHHSGPEQRAGRRPLSRFTTGATAEPTAQRGASPCLTRAPWAARHQTAG